MENKQTDTKRPTYFCFRDKTEKNIMVCANASKYDNI